MTWAAIPGWEGLYEASDTGEIRSLDRMVGNRLYAGQLISQPLNQRGYPLVSLWRHNKRVIFNVHVLIAAAFLGPRPNGLWVLHANDVPTDNRIQNLRYGSPGENGRDAVANGRHPWANRTHCPQGHEYAGDNLIVSINPKSGGNKRACRACRKANRRRLVTEGNPS